MDSHRQMNTFPQSVHLCIMQPAGYVHSLGFLDQARFFRYQFRRLGAQVSIGKNRLRHDAVNFIFGAHLMFEPELTQRYRCVFVNLEQLGDAGAQVTPAYLQLLSTSLVVDYDHANIPAYRMVGETVPIVTFAHAPYLLGKHSPALEERPIDLLFFGSVNDRRRRMLEDIQAAGCSVSMLQFGVYGAERDAEIRRAKAVFNCHFYDTGRFEQARAFQCLSLGTPIISERTATTSAPPQFEDSIFWVPSDGIRTFFESDFKAATFCDTARRKLHAFSSHDVLGQYEAVLAHARDHFAARPVVVDTPWRPEHLHIGSGKSYMPGCFNVDILASAEPDAVLDLSQPLELPARLNSTTVGPIELAPESIQSIYANNVLEHVGDLPQLMTNCLRLLRLGGQMLIEVPYEHAPSAWQDPTHVRAMNENAWIYYADWFWYLGWFETRFAVRAMDYLNDKLIECTREQAHFMRVRMEKVETTAAERSTARTMRPDFGGLPADELAAMEKQPISALESARPPQQARNILEKLPPTSDYYNGLNHKLLKALPDNAHHVLELGCANGRLGRRYKELHPNAHWVGVELDQGAAQTAAQYLDEMHVLDVDSDAFTRIGRGFDVVVIGDLLEHLRQPERLLERLYDMTLPGARIVCCLPNMAHMSVLRRLVGGDISYDNAGLLDRTHTRFYSPSSAYKVFLDAGWLPHMSDAYQLDEPHDAFTEHILAAAQAMGVPRETARRNAGLYQMIVTCEKWSMQELANMTNPRRFSVIVPVNRPWQFELNLQRSPGLAEVSAEVIVVNGAKSAAEAYEEGAKKASHPWRILAHQDVYFPTGTGYAIANQLGAYEAAGNGASLIGFAGLHAENGLDVGLRKTGLVVDRTHLFSEPSSDRAISLDEFAIVLHRDSPLRIDPNLGWHLWATDLCLQALAIPSLAPPSALRVPLFHNSTTAYELPGEFHASAATLLNKHAHLDAIPTLCGTLSR
jgi:SAM-dependent methyltransferase